MGQMHADLMRPPRLKPAGNQGAGRPPGPQYLVARNGRLAVFHHRHALAIGRAPTDRGIDLAFHGSRQAPAQRQVVQVQISFGEAFGKSAERQFRLGRDHDAGSVLIQPMHNAGPFFPANAGQIIPGMGQQRIDQRAILIAGRGVHHKARRFIKHDQIRILMQYGQGNILRLGQGRDGGRDIKRVKRAGANSLGGFA